jgi:hypothetical protein
MSRSHLEKVLAGLGEYRGLPQGVSATYVGCWVAEYAIAGHKPSPPLCIDIVPASGVSSCGFRTPSIRCPE